MKHLFWIFYDVVIRTLGLGISIHAIWSGKSSARIKGLVNWRADLVQLESPILFHVASLGEFEQARPVIEKIKKMNPDQELVLTFFSSSGFEIRKNYEHADRVMYLPLDTSKNMQLFVSKLNPSAIIFTKYDLWFNLIKVAQKQTIPCYLISSVFSSNHIYLRWYTWPLSRCLKSFKKIFTQDHDSVEILKKHGFSNLMRAGDTRVDRVIEIQDCDYDYSRIRQFKQGRKTFIIGSSWLKDENLVFSSLSFLLERGWCMILAPHETHESRINQITDALKHKFSLYSQFDNDEHDRYDVLIIDTIGDLNHLYKIGDIAYIGGGFDHGIHNTLEPAAAGLPIIFGPKYQKFEEARFMVDQKLAMAVCTVEEYKKALKFYMDQSIRHRVQEGLKHMIESRAGATNRIISTLKSDNIIKT